jgi:hypothetical protein
MLPSYHIRDINLDRTTAVHAADPAKVTVTNMKASKNWKLK